MSAQIDRLDKVNVFADVGGSGSGGNKLLKGADKNFGLNTDSRVFLGKGVCLMRRRDLFHADSPSGVAVEMIDPIFASPAFNPLEKEGKRCFTYGFIFSLLQIIINLWKCTIIRVTNTLPIVLNWIDTCNYRSDDAAKPTVHLHWPCVERPTW